MRAVGLRELKNRLSEYVRRVRAGEELLVTDHGEVVAEMRPPSRVPPGSRIDAGLSAMAREGILSLGADNDPAAYPSLPRLLSSTSIERLLDEERGPH